MKSRGVWVLTALLSGACGGVDNETDAPPGPEPEVITLPEGLSDGWNEMATGGSTICALGGAYAFWVRPGTVNKVVIDFQGGGACWNALTCGVASQSDAICTQSVDGVRAAVAAGVPAGIYDHERADNPFKDWYHVVVPYCSCDVHWGDNTTTYQASQGEITIQHRGAVNARAVLDWVYASFSKPEQILVTGCSAGSYGSIAWSAHIAEHYQKSRVVQFGDSGAGVITRSFFEQSFPSWKAEGAMPQWIDALDLSKVNLLDLTLADIYVGIANHYATQMFSQYNTAFDENQTFYYTAMGGTDAQAWSQEMHASIDSIKARAADFASFLPSGEQHCIIPFDNFYTVNVNGRRLVDWLGDMVADKPVEHVACEGSACEAPTP
ncbi:MAG TPA: pectin acetylesterase-family hydrolase [Polyangiaceae bacterium]|jgi:hypothetical protein|nr:pectin acetylesterase-family hydrolase [Polyangiaceae bacterium]